MTAMGFTVTEIPLHLEPVTSDPFITDLERTAACAEVPEDRPAERTPEPDADQPLPGPATRPAAGRWRHRLLPRAVFPPIWRELAVCAAQRVEGAPQTGAHEPVLLVPGYLSGDHSLRVLSRYLEHACYRPVPAGIACNAGCSATVLERLVARTEALADRHGTRVALVGHSRGGLLARALASRRPDLVSGVVMLASPVRDHLAVHPLVWAHVLGLAILGSAGLPGALRLSCAMGTCCERFWRDVRAPLPPTVGSMAIYTRGDGIVDWRACVDSAGPTLEVMDTTHCGMVADGPTLYAVAQTLARFRQPAYHRSHRAALRNVLAEPPEARVNARVVHSPRQAARWATKASCSDEGTRELPRRLRGCVR
jgi:pimeloyl-ACP methyl ester carboxylesterase